MSYKVVGYLSVEIMMKEKNIYLLASQQYLSPDKKSVVGYNEEDNDDVKCFTIKDKNKGLKLTIEDDTSKTYLEYIILQQKKVAVFIDDEKKLIGLQYPIKD